MCVCVHRCMPVFLFEHVEMCTHVRFYACFPRACSFVNICECARGFSQGKLCLHLTPYVTTHTNTVYIHGLSVVVFLDVFPSTLLNHENEIDSLGLNDGTADKQLLPASMACLSRQWFGAAKWHSCSVLLEQFPHKYFHSRVLVFASVSWCMDDIRNVFLSFLEKAAVSRMNRTR